MWLVAFLALMVFAGFRGARVLYRSERQAGGPFELASTIALLSLALALGLSWGLALPKLLTRGALLGGAGVVAAAAAWLAPQPGEWRSALDGARALLRRARAALRRTIDLEAATGIAVALGWIALATWGAFALWRGATVFSPNHDGVAYHLPKAAMIALAHGYQTFDGPDVRVSFWPCNYELLLADAILLDGNDVHTAWVGTASLVAFLLAVGATAERWWGRGPHVVLAILLAAGMTVVLLMSDAHKNDLMAGALFVVAVSSVARWAVEGEPAAAFVAIVSVAIAIGTKGSALFLIVALAPVAAWGLVRQWRLGRRLAAGRLAMWVATSVALVLLLGGAVFIRNALDTGRLMPSDPEVYPVYDGFANLWRFPYLAFARPFSFSPSHVWVPWRHAYMDWGRHDLFFSEWGLPSSLLLFALPFGVARYARRRPGDAAPVERALASFAFVLLFFLFLPLRMQKISILATAALCRYTLFLPVLIALWTAVPAVAELLGRGGRGRLPATVALFAAVALFAGYAASEARWDTYEPLDYVMDNLEHPEGRRIRRSAQNFRAGVIVDRIAGPRDGVAFDGGFDSWSYYCFGATLERPVTYLHPERGLPVTIPERARWVVIDRLVNIDFGHPSFGASGDFAFLGAGKPTPDDLAVFDQLRKDPHFELVYSYEAKNQAVFRRVPPS